VILIGSLTILGAVGIFVGGLLIRAVGGAASSILADEFKAAVPEGTQKIIRFAARRIPEHARQEMLETWLAEASEYQGRPLKALRFALINCLAAAPGVARQLRPALASAGGGTKETGTKKEMHARRANSDLIRREVRWMKDFLRVAHRSWRDSLRLVTGSFGASANLLLAVIRDVARLFGEVIEGLGALVVGITRGVVELLGPYDYSREWRSVMQLLVKTVAMASTLSIVFAGFFFVVEVVFGL
jgi:hypothetical protein